MVLIFIPDFKAIRVMLTNIPKHKIPPDLSCYLEGKQVDFMVMEHRSFFEVVSRIFYTIINMFILTFIMKFIYDNYDVILKFILNLIEKRQLLDIIFFIGFVYIIVVAIYEELFKKSLHIDFYRNLIHPPIFVGTNQQLIIYQNGQIAALSWRYFNPSILVHSKNKQKGDILFRLYNDRKIINEYDGKTLKPKAIQINSVVFPHKIEKIARKYIDQIQGE